jgi:hypothetical protein
MGILPDTRFKGLFEDMRVKMQDRKLTPDMVPVIKLARSLKYNYARIASYFQINQGRIADVMKGRHFPDIPPADALPSDFPSA